MLNDEEDENVEKCIYIMNGIKCKYNKKIGKYCGIHKKIIDKSIKQIEQTLVQDNSILLKDKILLLDTTLENKSIIMKHFKNIKRLDPHATEYYKNYIFVENCIQVPWGIYKSISISKGINEKRDILINVRKNLDEMVYEMNSTKEEIMNYTARMLTNPNSTRNILGLYGLAGSGKTRMVHAIAKALNREVKTISLGGIKDASYFLGHGYVYVESGPGAITQSLIDTRCMNPIIYFDELDKVSETGGKDIYSFLTYLTDPIQNVNFKEHYFNGIKFDLSKVFFIFTFNDKKRIDSILLDRINLINIQVQSIEEKIDILYNFCIPDIIKNIGLDDTLAQLIRRDSIRKLVINFQSQIDVESTGIRELYRIIESVLMEYNKNKILIKEYKFEFDSIYKIVKDRENKSIDSIQMSMYI
jgi:ATP-dependent Lon protease